VLVVGILAAGAAVAWVLSATSSPRLEGYDPTPRVTINGVTWKVELAVTDEQRRVGLSNRTELAQETGMLFVFDRPQILSFCMRDCYIPLDIAFIGSDKRVVQTYTMSVEPDRAGRAMYESRLPAKWALEVPAGSLDKAKVKIGHKVEFAGDIPDGD
jgi:uncharacterized membrane protein (UPF0127 family)